MDELTNICYVCEVFFVIHDRQMWKKKSEATNLHNVNWTKNQTKMKFEKKKN